MSAMGPLGDSERKSVEPIAARACADPELCRAYHDRLPSSPGPSSRFRLIIPGNLSILLEVCA
jgi:hypothetical protein